MNVSIGNHQAFPVYDGENTYGVAGSSDGMTYRQWLLGHIASGFAASDLNLDTERIALASIKFGDAIIAALDQETANNG